MKNLKNFVLVLTLVLILNILNTENADSKLSVINIGSGNKKGIYYTFALNIKKLIEKKTSIKVHVHETKGSAENSEQMLKKNFEMSLMQNDIAFYCSKGFDCEKNNQLRTIGTLFNEDINIIVNKNKGIKNIEDLRGKNIAVGNYKSGQKRNSEQILKYKGLEIFVNPDMSKIDIAASKLKDESIDGLFYTVGRPAEIIQNIFEYSKFELISLSKDHIQELIIEYPFYSESHIPGGTYKGQEHPIKTVAVRSMLVVRSDIDIDDIFKITKILYENIEKIKEVGGHPKWEEVSLANSRLGYTIPFHDGYNKFFNESTIPVKKQPFDQSDTIGYIKKGTKNVAIFNDRFDMYQIISNNNVKGWIDKRYTLDFKERVVVGLEVVNKALNFRNKPNLITSIVKDVLYKGERMELLDIKMEYLDNKRFKKRPKEITWGMVVRANGDIGYISKNYKYSKTIKFKKKSCSISTY